MPSTLKVNAATARLTLRFSHYCTCEIRDEDQNKLICAIRSNVEAYDQSRAEGTSLELEHLSFQVKTNRILPKQQLKPRSYVRCELRIARQPNRPLTCEVREKVIPAFFWKFPKSIT